MEQPTFSVRVTLSNSKSLLLTGFIDVKPETEEPGAIDDLEANAVRTAEQMVHEVYRRYRDKLVAAAAAPALVTLDLPPQSTFEENEDRMPWPGLETTKMPGPRIPKLGL